MVQESLVRSCFVLSCLGKYAISTELTMKEYFNNTLRCCVSFQKSFMKLIIYNQGRNNLVSDSIVADLTITSQTANIGVTLETAAN